MLKEEFTNKKEAEKEEVIQLHVEVTPGLHRGFQSEQLTHRCQGCPHIWLDLSLFELLRPQEKQKEQ